MSKRDIIFPKMNVMMLLIGPNGEIKEIRKGKNMVVITGLNHIADQLSSSPGEAVMTAMRVGTGTTATSAATTTLQTYAGSATLDSRTDSGAVVTYVATLAAGVGTGALTEAGIFNAALVMLCRIVYAVINKGSLDSLVITWTCTIADDDIGA